MQIAYSWYITLKEHHAQPVYSNKAINITQQYNHSPYISIYYQTMFVNCTASICAVDLCMIDFVGVHQHKHMYV